MNVVECEDDEDEEGCANMGMGDDDMREHIWLLVGDERKRQAHGLPHNVAMEGEEHKERKTPLSFA
jgi:hypothetical protein